MMLKPITEVLSEKELTNIEVLAMDKAMDKAREGYTDDAEEIEILFNLYYFLELEKYTTELAISKGGSLWT